MYDTSNHQPGRYTLTVIVPGDEKTQLRRVRAILKRLGRNYGIRVAAATQELSEPQGSSQGKTA